MQFIREQINQSKNRYMYLYLLTCMYMYMYLHVCTCISLINVVVRAIVKVTGNMDFSFPASCISQLESCEPLKFRLMNVSMVNKILHNENILKR